MLVTVLTASAFALAFCMALAAALVARELEARVETLESELRTERRILRKTAADADARFLDVLDRLNSLSLARAPKLGSLRDSADAASLASARAFEAVSRYLEDAR